MSREWSLTYHIYILWNWKIASYVYKNIFWFIEFILDLVADSWWIAGGCIFSTGSWLCFCTMEDWPLWAKFWCIAPAICWCSPTQQTNSGYVHPPPVPQPTYVRSEFPQPPPQHTRQYHMVCIICVSRILILCSSKSCIVAGWLGWWYVAGWTPSVFSLVVAALGPQLPTIHQTYRPLHSKQILDMYILHQFLNQRMSDQNFHSHHLNIPDNIIT
jgi:hypothetical protein